MVGFVRILGDYIFVCSTQYGIDVMLTLAEDIYGVVAYLFDIERSKLL